MQTYDVDAAVERMRRRREVIRAAREQFEALPRSVKENLRYGFQLAEEEARAIVHRRRPVEL